MYHSDKEANRKAFAKMVANDQNLRELKSATQPTTRTLKKLLILWVASTAMSVLYFGSSAGIMVFLALLGLIAMCIHLSANNALKDFGIYANITKYLGIFFLLLPLLNILFTPATTPQTSTGAPAASYTTTDTQEVAPVNPRAGFTTP